jgi:hypothetical protein
MMRRVVPLAAVLALMSLLGGCSSSTSPTGTATPTPGPNTVALGSVAPLANQVFVIPVNTAIGGVLTLQVTWTSATDVLLVGIATSSCSVPAYRNAACTFLAVDGSTATTATKTLATPVEPANTYVVVIDNQGPGIESVTYTLTRS